MISRRSDSKSTSSAQPCSAPDAQMQMPLFAGSRDQPAEEKADGKAAIRGDRPREQRRLVMNPHLIAARKLARKIARLPDHSSEQTQTGLAICQHLKALLRDTANSDTQSDLRKPPQQH